MGKSNAVFEVLRTGKHYGSNVTVKITEEDLAGIAKLYSTKIRTAPLVIGHPEDDRPELGQVKKLYAIKDKLFADVEIYSELIEKIKRGEISGISVSIYFRTTEENPVRGVGMYLKHVGFLERGKDEPAVKGMTDPILSVLSTTELSSNDKRFIIFSEDKLIKFYNEQKTAEFGKRSTFTEQDKNAHLLNLKVKFFENITGLSYRQAFEIIQG
ncbi:hypothetical protein [Lonepinella sp. MS14435]|uniref:hypothetical protein n=1 Tax=Lonepinella sp. MS14435 TaxID=3003618 RepID=UPI0036DA07DE